MTRLFSRLLGLFWQLAALLLILIAAYVALGRELVPLVAEYRVELEQRARAAGLPLRIGRLEGRWQGLAPLLVAEDVDVGEGEQRLHLDRATLRPALLSSLLKRRAQIAHLHLEGLQLHLREQEDGRWRVDGLPKPAEDKPLDLARLLEQSGRLERLSLSAGRLLVEPRDQEPLALTYVQLSLRQGERQRLDGRLVLPDGQPLAFHVDTRLNVADWRASPASLYLNLPQSNWAAWVPARLTPGWDLQKLAAGGEFWLHWQYARVERLTGRLRANNILAQRGEALPLALDDLTLDLFFRQQEQGFELVLDSLAFSLGEERWGNARIGVRRSEENGEPLWQASADRIDIRPLAGLAEAAVELPPRAHEILAALQPRGRIANLQLSFRPSLPLTERLQFSAGLDRIGVDPFLASPGLENVSGRIEGGIGGGELRVDSEDFVLHLDKLFPEPWQYRRARATLNWHFDDQAFSLSAPYIRVLGEEGTIGADFMIRLIHDPAAEDYMDLRVGLRDSEARFTPRYLPTRSPAMSQPLAQWLQTAIRGGQVDEGWFQFQGALNKGAAPEARSLSLFFRVRDAELAFQPGWPELRDVHGDVLIEDEGIRVLASHGRLLDAEVRDVLVSIPRVPDQPLRLKVDGKVEADLADAIKVLKEAPTPAASVFAGWQGKGPLSGELKLDLPLGKGAPAHVRAAFSTREAQLQLAEPAVTLEQLSGDFVYDTREGLSAPEIHAQAFGSAIRGRARALGKGQAHTRLDVGGRIAWPRLAKWLQIPQPLPLEGQLPYDLVVDLDGEDSRLSIRSSLKGLAVDLPEPFNKPAGKELPSELRMTLAGRERRYEFVYGEVAGLLLAAPPGRLGDGRGELRIGGQPRLPTSPGLRIAGRVPNVEWAAWKALLDRLGGTPKAGQSGLPLELVSGGELRIDRFDGFGLQVADLRVGLQNAGQSWTLKLDSEPIAGRIGLPKTSGQPLDVDLDWLRLPEPKPREEKSDVDPLADVDPRSLPAMDVRISKLSLGERPVGGWSFALRPDAGGARLESLSLGLRGALLTGQGYWEMGEAGLVTRYQGRLEGSDLADVLRAWDFAPTLSSKRFRLDVDGRWPGSPAAVSLAGFSGVMGGRMDEGQVRELDGNASALRVFGLLNFDSIGRRLRLDFSDMLGRGLSYDRFRGVLHASDGVYRTDKPMTMEGPSSNFELEGILDMRQQRIDAKVLVTLPVSNNLSLAALLLGAPAVGGALLIADKLLGDEIARFASVRYDVNGPLDDPKISFDKPFEKPR